MITSSLLEAARLAQPGLPDAALVEGVAEEIGRTLQLAPPVDLSLLASYQGIVSITEESMPWSGYLMTTSRGLEIRLNALHPETRRRFTVAHEVGHTLLPGFAVATQFRCSPGKSRPGDESFDVERLADLAASEFLLPQRFFEPAWRRLPWGMASVDELAAEFNASRDAVARRVLRVSDGPVAFLDLRMQRSKGTPDPKLRVHAFYGSKSWASYIPRNKSIGPDHPFQRAFGGELIDTTTDLSCLTGSPIPMYLSAQPYQVPTEGGGTVTRVLALARPQRSVPRQRS